MSSHTRPTAKRGPSGAWGRLRAPNIDPLEVYGLPSKGETRLSDHKTQETFFERIVTRYMTFCVAHPSGETLEEAFTSLTLASKPDSSSPPQELQMLLMAMRKLREALVSTSRVDAFAQRAYTFICRACILCRHLESYHPCLLHLLNRVHPKTPLSPPEILEFAGYLILDTACRQNDLEEAYRLKKAYGLKDRKVDMVLKALVHDDWVAFWRAVKVVDGYQRALLAWAEQRVRLHALKCLGHAYMQADRAFVERAADREWSDLVAKDNVGWLLQDNGVVVIRKPKAR